VYDSDLFSGVIILVYEGEVSVLRKMMPAGNEYQGINVMKMNLMYIKKQCTLKRDLAVPFLQYVNLLVVDVHCYFETEANVAVFRCFPFHHASPNLVEVGILLN